MPRLAGANTDVSPEDANKRTKILLIALGAVVVIAAVFWFLVKPALTKSSNNGSAAAATAPVVTPPTHTAPKPKATLVPTPSPSPSPQFNGSTRDPFAPLAIEKAAAISTVAPSAASTAVAANPSPSAAPAAPAAATGSHTITLVSISSGSADLTVEGKDKTVKAGDTVETGVSCIKVTDDSVFITYKSKAYAIAPGQTITF